jgi:hypothetical protein
MRAGPPGEETDDCITILGGIPVKLGRTLLLAAAVVGAVAHLPASADVSVTIDQTDGTMMASVPPPGDLADYPDAVVDEFTGKASFTAEPGSVFVMLSQKPVGGTMDPFNPGTIGQPADYIPVFQGEADLTCTESGCTWTFRIPWILPPGEYKATAIASEPNPELPEEPGPTASASVLVTIL